jgi:hypothetical protein
VLDGQVHNSVIACTEVEKARIKGLEATSRVSTLLGAIRAHSIAQAWEDEAARFAHDRDAALAAADKAMAEFLEAEKSALEVQDNLENNKVLEDLEVEHDMRQRLQRILHRKEAARRSAANARVLPFAVAFIIILSRNVSSAEKSSIKFVTRVLQYVPFFHALSRTLNQ